MFNTYTPPIFSHDFIEVERLIRIDEANRRIYQTPNGDKYASVTTILSKYNTDWVKGWRNAVGAKKADSVLRSASLRGTDLHSVVEEYLRNQNPSLRGLMPTVKTTFVKIRPELNKLNNIRCLETQLYSDKLRIAGTVDCIAEYNGKLSVIDFKSSSKKKVESKIKSYFMQGTAYVEMIKERTGIHIDNIVILVSNDVSDQCQVFEVNPKDHIEDLQKCIDSYYAGTVI